MERSLVLVTAALIGCGSGSHAPTFKLQLAANGSSAGELPKIELRAGETKLLQLLVVGAVPWPVTFALAGAPAFVTLDGPLLTLAPQRQDAGDYTFNVTATSGQESQTATLQLSVLRFNSAPNWRPAVNLTDAQGFRWMAWACPSASTCTVLGDLEIDETPCDMEGDAMKLDVEVVPRGQKFTGQPTFSFTSARVPLPDPRWGGCATIRAVLTGLVPEQSYLFALRVSDEFGAVARATDFPDGWYSSPVLAFDQGPCTTKKCACFSALGTQCQVETDCCSGHCVARPLPLYPDAKVCE